MNFTSLNVKHKLQHAQNIYTESLKYDKNNKKVIQAVKCTSELWCFPSYTAYSFYLSALKEHAELNMTVIIHILQGRHNKIKNHYRK